MYALSNVALTCIVVALHATKGDVFAWHPFSTTVSQYHKMKKNITNHSRLPFFIGTILLIVFTIGVAANGIAQTTVVKEVPVEKTYFDNGYYKYEMTGNTEIDTENQKVAKEETKCFESCQQQ